ncbi:unnamed protein product [Penicillium salamii]|uniref:NACHT domain-containing protein n=1 Tax=Penicillium salamii TaxID=1612424 RepID=A0A9W4JHV6_9EURO|nr:unnamed protein product [Penicillium salamii]CAG8175811.1 unnamed protein product [Penicillium salamii]CAG8306175.1 unnamed protein product [Penicillium salamii]CAG8358380.1 unnamed protein product [Penicillium salamii]CAG8391778.1 unnamed protein product [Penicillium salamii]
MEIPSHTKNRFGDACASGDGTAFQLAVNNGAININQRTRQILLPKVAYNAAFDGANKEHTPSCLPGTRVKVLEEIQAWINGDNPRKVYWLSGMAGTGKSTIALTLARTYKPRIETAESQRDVCLGATFFFSRGGGDLSSASKFPATIAIQLAEASRELRGLIERVIEENPRLDSLGVQAQWEKIVIGPLALLSRSPGNCPTFLLIVDALDECNDANDANAIIRCLEKVTQISGVGCRVFLTSRPEQSIRLGMHADASVPRQNFVLHDIERSIVDQDLELYYRDQLCRIKAMMSSEVDIISERAIGKLVERSSGLFIHAATVCRFVHEGGWFAVERLNQLLETEKSDSAELELNKMYMVVLEYSFVSVTKGLTRDEAEQVHQLFQHIVGAIIVMFDTMSSESLASLLGVERQCITKTLSSLHSVINVPERHTEPIQILHPSFREFLLDPHRCTDNFFAILVSDAHSRLLTRCFAYLMSQLKRNILDISKPGTKARDVSTERIDRKIPMELQYSSMYWWSHFQNSDDHSQKELPLLEFLEGKYLFWLECLAWPGKLGHAIQAMSDMNPFIIRVSPQSGFSISMSNHRKSKKASQIYTFVLDALQFLLRNKLMIEEAPLQLYLSALIFSPNSSEVKKRNRKEIPNWVLIEPHVPDDRKKLPGGLSIAHSSVIHSFAVSPDSSLVATACGDCMVHIWDAKSGMERLKLEGNPDGVARVCFSPDGCLVAALAQSCVSVWNIEGAFGVTIQPECQFHFNRQGSGTASPHHPACAISPCGNLVAVIDYPHDIWVWDMRVKQSVKYHFQVEAQRPITGVYFSFDGSLLICVTIWSEKTYPKETLDAWSTSTGINFSHGIMSGTRDPSKLPTSLWSSGGAHLIFFDRFPDEGVVLISLGDDASIKTSFASAAVWLRAFISGSEVALLMGEQSKRVYLKTDSSQVKSIEFSPNGRHLITTNSSDELRIWNMEGLGSKPSRFVEMYDGFREIGARLSRSMRRMTRAPLHLQDQKSSYRFEVWIRSCDGSLLATGSWRGSTITIWDMRTGEEKFRLSGFTNPSFMQFSESGNIFTLMDKSSVHFWETKTGQKGDIFEINRRESLNALDYMRVSANGGKVLYVEYLEFDVEGISDLCVWELDGLRKSSSFKIPVHSPTPLKIAISPNEEMFCLWKKGSPSIEVGSFPSNTVESIDLRDRPRWVGFMPDGQHILISGDTTKKGKDSIQIWNIERKGSRVFYNVLPQNVRCDIFHTEDTDFRSPEIYGSQHTKSFISPDGKILALGRRQPNHVEIYLLKISEPESLFKLIDLPDIPKQKDRFGDQHGPPGFLQFAPSGTHISTERGNVRLPGASLPSPLLFATRSWIQEDGEDILAIPPAYQDSFRGIYGHTVMFGDRDNGPLFVGLDEGMKSMTS